MSLRNTIQAWAERLTLFPEGQGGFRPGRSCTDQIFTVTAVLQLHLRLEDRPAFGLFVDFRTAFDYMQHAKLWYKLFHLCLSANVIKIMKSLYGDVSLRVRVGSNLTDHIEVAEGVLQP